MAFSDLHDSRLSQLKELVHMHQFICQGLLKDGTYQGLSDPLLRCRRWQMFQQFGEMQLGQPLRRVSTVPILSFSCDACLGTA